MPFIEVAGLPVVEPRPGWHAQFFHSDHMTFAYYAIDPGAEVHSHEHGHEEVWHVLEGELELTLAQDSRVLAAGTAAVVPAGERHSVRALAACRVIVVDHPVRTSVGGVPTGK
jgi:quercetin dioxygenase-like cupin family protein